ncbi:response regulator [Campylobacter sp. RM13119]|uniref:response regulator n=1 Tax=Campylobacter californiensis TaxID=1032243 RepID=UPI00147389FD|nr:MULTISPECIES: response regulator [unclassified Campylobacter]MBE3606270.1 response regulator [Campylobacter sp. RM13119]MBE3608947.1 response regulator [Campylobacter sp. RM12916]
MKVQNNSLVDFLSQLEAGKNEKNKSLKFDEILNSALKNKTSKNDLSQEVEDFKQRLSELGAYGYITQLNEDKIEQKIAQKRNELIETLGINDPNKSNDQRSELLKILEEMLSEYRKQIQNSLASQSILEKQQQLAGTKYSVVNLNSVLAELSLA